MSQIPLIEWSPESCLYVDPATHQVMQSTSPVEALAALGRPKRINLAMGRRQVFVKTIRLPDVGHEEAKNLLRFRLEELFPLPASELAFDLIFTDDRSSEGRLAVVFAAKSETVRQALALFAHAGVKVDQLIPAGLGASMMAEAETAAVVVSQCSEGTAFDVVELGSLVYSRVTNRPTTVGDTESEAARAVAASGIQSPTKVVVQEALKELAPTGASLTAQHPFEVLTHRHPAVNLRLPEDIARAGNEKLLARRRLASLLICATFLVGALAWWDRDDAERAVAKERAETTSQLDKIKHKSGLVNKRIAAIEKESGMVTDGLSPRQNLSDVMALAANSVPDGLWLTGMTIERGKDLTLRGTAKANSHVRAFVDTLSATERLRDVTLVFSNNNAIGETPVVQFSITAHVVGNLPLIEPKKERNRR